MAAHCLDPNYGNGVVSLDFSSYEEVEPQEVLRCLRDVFRSPSFNPPRLPAAAIQLLELSRKPEVTAEAITLLLEQDQLLAAEVLKLAQSPAHNPSGQPVRTLSDAVVRLGMRRTSDLFLQASMQMRVFRVKGYQPMMTQLTNHSVMVAHLARHISRLTSLFDEHAFLCGLLHDAGIVASLVALADSTKRGTSPPQFSQVWEPVQRAHMEAGRALSKVWGLPDEIALVMEHHHDFVIGGYAHPTAAVVALADAVANQVGRGFFDEVSDGTFERAAKSLGLSTVQLEGILSKARELASAQP